MKIPDPYFENVPHYGTLHMEEIIVNYDYPLLSVLKDDNNRRYISICYSIMESQQWIVVPISNDNLIGLLTNQIAITSVYKNSNSKIVLATRNYTTRKDSYQLIDATNIPIRCLPDDNEYLDAEDNEWLDYVTCLRSEINTWKSVFFEFLTSFTFFGYQEVIVPLKSSHQSFSVSPNKKSKTGKDKRRNSINYSFSFHSALT